MPNKADFDHRFKLVEKAIDEHGMYLERVYLRGLTKNSHDAEDLANELWLHVLNRFKTEEITDLSRLRRKAYQLFVDYWRRQQRNPVTAVEELPDSPVSSNITEPSTHAEEEAFKERFFSEYPADLTEDQKTALWLHARMGYTFVEVGQIMQKPQSTVGDWVKQARATLAEHLNNN